MSSPPSPSHSSTADPSANPDSTSPDYDTSDDLHKPTTLIPDSFGEGGGSTDSGVIGSPELLKESFLLENSSSASAFEALEKDFREVLNELVGDKSLERFRLEYEKLHQTLKKSHENEKRLIKKCRELNAEIVSNAAKIQTALRLSIQDQNSIALLKKEIDKAWKMVDSAQEKEKRARETIQRLKGEIQHLSRLVDQGAGLSIGQENAVNELLKVKEDLSKELERQNGELEASQKRIAELQGDIGKYQQEVALREKDIESWKEKHGQMKSEMNRHHRRAERLQMELVTLKEINDKRKDEIAGKSSELQNIQQKLSDSEGKIKHFTMTVEKFAHLTEELKGKNEELEKNLESLQGRFLAMQNDKSSVEEESKEVKALVKKLQQEMNYNTKKREKVEKEKEAIAGELEAAQGYRDQLKVELKTILKRLEEQRKDSETDEKLIKELQMQLKRLTIHLHLNSEKNNLQMKLVEENEQQRKQLEMDLLAYKSEQQALRAKNYQLEKEKEKEQVKSSGWYQKFCGKEEELKLKDMECMELKKQIEEERNKLKIQQHLYEQVRADRNLFSKQQTASEDEMAEMKRKFTILQHQMDQLKEEIATKDAALINEHFALKRMQDEMKIQKRKLLKRKEVLMKADAVLASQDAEIKNLRRTLHDAEQAQVIQKKIYDDVVNERDIMGTQLIRRNDELALLYEKIRIQQSTLAKGEMQYRERILDLRRLKLYINTLKRQLQLSANETSNVDSLKNEIYHLQRELLGERTKVKALSEELENPMNVHRWRKLEGSDPKRFELILKIQTLQKRLIKATESIVEKDLLIQEKEELYKELKALLARQPGPEISEQLAKYQSTLRDKNKQMKAMAAELNMLTASSAEQKYEMERINRELMETKKMFFMAKKREQIQSERDRRSATGYLDPAVQQATLFAATQPKIVGGGFNIQQQQRERDQLAATQ